MDNLSELRRDRLFEEPREEVGPSPFALRFVKRVQVGRRRNTMQTGARYA